MHDHHENDFKEWRVVEALPVTLEIQHANWKRQFTTLDAETGLFSGEFSSFDSFLISKHIIETATSCSCGLKEAGKIINLYFNISGSRTFHLSGNPHTIAAEQQNIYFSSGHDDQVFLQPENEKLEDLEIHIPVSYYINLLAEYSSNQTAFINAILKGNEHILQLGIMPMTMPMKWIINTLKLCTRTGVLRRLFFEAKILELLMLQIEQSEYYAKEQPQRIIKPSLIEAYHEAKNIIEKNLDNPPTIRNLARLVGINEFDLKKGFKDTFNITIYGYVNELKMQLAKQMILEGDKSIQQIATLSGYKNPQHFTVAFKKYFGQLPSKLKILPLLLLTLVGLAH